MTFGRPSAITAYADNLDLPLDLEDSDLRPGNHGTPAAPPSSGTPQHCTSVTFYIVSIKLYTLIGRIIEDLYGGNLNNLNPSSSSADSSNHNEFQTKPPTQQPTFTDIARVAEIEAALSSWRSSLPSALSIVSASDIPTGGGPISQFWRQSIILSLRYYNTRALLHRPFAVKGLAEIWGAGPSRDRFEGDFFWNFGWASIKACSDAAISTIEIVDKVKHRSDLLGFWWFTVFFVFNASLVLVSKILIIIQVRHLQLNPHPSAPSLGSETSTLLRHLSTALEALDVLATNNRIANRSRLFLKNLMRYVTPLAAAASTPASHHVNSLPATPAGWRETPRPATSGGSDVGPTNTSSTNPGLRRRGTTGGAEEDTHRFNERRERVMESLQNNHSFMGLGGNMGLPGMVAGGIGGEFMLESDLGFLSSMLPPVGFAVERTGDREGGEGEAQGWAAGWGGMGGFAG